MDRVCIYSIKLLFFKVLIGRCTFSLGDGFKIENVANNLPEDTKIHPHLASLYTEELLSHLVVAKLRIYFNFGIEDDADKTALVCGGMQAVSAGVIAWVLNNNRNATICQSIVPNFENSECEMTMLLSLKINLLLIIVSYIRSKKIYKKKYKGAVNE
ncbi:MAG: hypothetical protein IJS68_01740 [Clostridia bacterium]|nr:hypothetical protein [Clostridia bacterium]